MTTDALYAAVVRFAAATHNFSEAILNSTSWAYEAYDGVRYALLHTTLELSQLATHLQAERSRQGRAPSVAQQALGLHRAALRDFEALLIGIDAGDYQRRPSATEWALNIIVAHVHEVERYFFGAILNSVRNPQPEQLEDAELAALVEDALEIATDAPFAAMWARYAALHARITATLAPLTDAELALRSPAWEPEPWPSVEFRLHRFASHLREHTNQVEKVLGLLDRRPNEARMLLRQLYAALALVESACIGAEEVGKEACAAMAARIDARLASLLPAVARAREFLTAFTAGDGVAVEALLRENPALAYSVMEDGLSAVLWAQYRGQQDLVAVLLASGMRLRMAEAAAVGDAARVRRIAEAWPQALEDRSVDGYTPLQLACFFGHAEIAQYLVEKGADVHAVAQNAMRIQPLHAAVAGQHVAIVRLLLGHGADANARQQDDFTPLMAARQHGNAEIEALLLAAGAQ